MSVIATAPASEGNKFLNPVPTKVMSEGSMVSVLGAYITNKNEVVPRHLPGPFHTDVSVYETPPATGLRITWIGHSSLLIEIDGKRLLTDPVWSKRASFSSFIGPKRFFAPPIALQDLPPLDAIIISHDHYDHLDAPTIRFFADKAVPFYCSLNVGRYLQQYGIAPNRITEMDWTNQVTLGSDCTITALPARHFSGRGLFNRFTTLLVVGCHAARPAIISITGPTAALQRLCRYRRTMVPSTSPLLEIGASNTYWADIHMGPVHAAEAHLALKGKLIAHPPSTSTSLCTLAGARLKHSLQ